MKLFKKVAIIGTGLIGGSVGLAVKQKHLADRVVGVSRSVKNLRWARKIKAIDEGSQSLRIIKDADLVVFAAPVRAIVALAPEAAKFLKEDCIVTDVGSSKTEICAALHREFPLFVGSHPLAGSEKRSIFSARGDLFQNSLCVLTPVAGTDRKALGKLQAFWKKLGAKTVLLSPPKHDCILAFVSHLPHLAAFALISAVPKKFFSFAATGLRDSTRIASSDPTLWADVFVSNEKQLLGALGSFEEQITRLKNAVRKQDKKLLIKLLSRAQEKRKGLA